MDKLDYAFAIATAVLIVIGYAVFVVAEIRSSLRIERRCKQLAKQLEEEARELGIEVGEQ